MALRVWPELGLERRDVTLRAVDTGFGFIGLGHMGMNAVRNLLAQGQRVVVYNRTHEKVDVMVR